MIAILSLLVNLLDNQTAKVPHRLSPPFYPGLPVLECDDHMSPVSYEATTFFCVKKSFYDDQLCY